MYALKRSFRVKISDGLSMTYYQETGVPQGKFFCPKDQKNH